MKVEIIRIDGSAQELEIAKAGAISYISRLIGAPQGLDTVNLRDGRVMLVDDTGMIDGRPVNRQATRHYHAVCRPGTTAPICGDVAIVLDADFA